VAVVDQQKYRHAQLQQHPSEKLGLFLADVIRHERLEVAQQFLQLLVDVPIEQRRRDDPRDLVLDVKLHRFEGANLLRFDGVVFGRVRVSVLRGFFLLAHLFRFGRGVRFGFHGIVGE